MRPEWFYGYVRFYSDDVESDEPKRIIEEFAKEKGYKLQGIIVERNVPSRDPFDFPGLKDLFCRFKKNDHVLLVDFSHINRDIHAEECQPDLTYWIETVEFVRKIEEEKGKLTLITEDFLLDTTDTGHIMTWQMTMSTMQLWKKLWKINREKYVKRIKELEEQLEKMKVSKI